jgi:hypothetical protein
VLSFPVALAGALKASSTSGYFYVKLYFGDESNFTGLSDTDRTIDSVKYRGLVQSWGDITQQFDINTFQSAISTTSITIYNGPNVGRIDDTTSAAGGRFSDLFATQNYVNRKWIMYLGASGVPAASHAQIGEGVITDQIEQGNDYVTFRLADYGARESLEVPIDKAERSTYTNISDGNDGKPFPMMYGDLSQRTATGEWERHYVRGHAPALVVDPQDTDGKVNCAPDTLDTSRSITLNSLDAKNVYITSNGRYLACDDGNVTISTPTPGSESDHLIKFTGGIWYALGRPVLSSTGALDANAANIVDGNPDNATGSVFTCAANDTDSFSVRVPNIPKLGENYANADIDIIVNFSAFSGTPIPAGANDFYITIEGATLDANWGTTGAQAIALSSGSGSAYDAADLLAGDLSTQVVFNIDNALNGSPVTVTIKEVDIQIQVQPSQTYEYSGFIKDYDYTHVADLSGNIKYQKTEVYRRGLRRGPSGLDYAYIAGKGREYNTWIDTIDGGARATFTGVDDPGYNANALIENPVYIVESILRDEIGIDPSSDGTELNVARFDEAGNTTDGIIGNIFNDSVTDILFAFSQVSSVDGFELCRDIAECFGGILFWDANGKVSLACRDLSANYTSADTTIEYKDIGGVKPGRTSIAAVRNRVTLRYNYDHAAGDYLSEVVVNDTTSQDSGANGINAIKELVFECPYIIDETTATALGNYVLDRFAYQRLTLSFNAPPKYLDLEIGDTVSFKNWPADFKIYGNTIDDEDDASTDIFMINKITKKASGVYIECFQVSEVTD